MPTYIIQFKEPRATSTIKATHVAIQGMGALIVLTNGYTNAAETVAVFPTDSVISIIAEPGSLGG